MKSAEPAHQAINDDTIESKVLYTFDRRSSLPALIDSGASISIFPSGYASQVEQTPKRGTGITNFEIRIDGTTTMTLDLDLGQTISHKFLVANLPEKFIILRADFLRKFKVKLNFDEKTMTMASKRIKLDYNNYHNLVNHQEAKPEVLLFTFKVTVDQLAKHEENIYHSSETLYKQMLKDFPNITGTTDYTEKPKHAHILNIVLIDEDPITQNPVFVPETKR